MGACQITSSNQLKLVSQPTETTFIGDIAKQYKIGTYFMQKFEPSRIQKWSTMSAVGLDNFASKNSTLFERRLCKGPPAEFRWKAWQVYLNIDWSWNDVVQYNKQDLSEKHQIGKDVQRTFPKHKYFQEQYHTLFTVLCRFASYRTNVGYCQGMNQILGFMLMVSGSNEVESFYMLDYFFTKFDLQHFYSEEMPYIKANMFIFDKMLKKFCPQVRDYLQELGVGYETWAMRWFMTLFTDSPKFDAVLLIWDNFIVRGQEFLHKVAIALVKSVKNQVLSATDAEIPQIMANGNNLSIEVVKKAQKIKIGRDKFRKYMRQYFTTKKNQ